MSEALPLSLQVAGEVRAHLARARIRTSTVAAALELSLTGVHKRLNGAIPFSVDELAVIAELLGIDVTTLIAQSERIPA